MNYTNIRLQTRQDKDMILLFENNNIRGGISSVMGSRCVQSDEIEKMFYIDANSLYGWAIMQRLPYVEIKSDKNVKLQDIFNNEDNIVISYILEVDIKYLDEIEEKTKHFPFCPGNKVCPQDNFSDFFNKSESKTYTPCKKLICD